MLGKLDLHVPFMIHVKMLNVIMVGHVKMVNANVLLDMLEKIALLQNVQWPQLISKLYI